MFIGVNSRCAHQLRPPRLHASPADAAPLPHRAHLSCRTGALFLDQRGGRLERDGPTRGIRSQNGGFSDPPLPHRNRGRARRPSDFRRNWLVRLDSNQQPSG